MPGYALNFTTLTKEEKELPFQGRVICVSTGQLEREILQMMRK